MEIIKIVQDGIELDVNGGEINANSITQDTNNRFVTDSEKTTWNNKVDKVSGKQLSTNDYTTVEKNKLAGIQAGAQVNAVTSVNGQTGAVTTPDTTYNVATTSANGLMSSADKVKLNGVEAGAQKNIMTSADKTKLDGIETGAQKNTVTSVQGRTGVVTISKSDVGLGNVDNLSAASIRSGTTKSNVGLGNVDNIKQMPISGGVLENYREKLVNLTSTDNTPDLNEGNVFVQSPSGNRSYWFSNAINNQAHSFTLIINMGSTVRTLTFPASVKWQGGEIPDMSTANKTYVLTFMSVNGGTTWLGMFGGEF